MRISIPLRSTRYLQLLVAAAAFIYVLYMIDAREARALLLAANLYLLPVAAVISLAGLALAGLRWRVLLRPLGVCLSSTAAFRCYLAGSFYGLAMPGVIGGDVARVLICRRETGKDVGLVTTTVLLERGLGVVVLLCVLAAGLSISTPLSFFLPDSAAGLATGLAAAALIISLSTPRLFGLVRLIDRDGKRRTHPAIAALVRPLRTASTLSSKSVLLALLLSLGFQLADLLATFVIAAALGVELSVSALLVALPLAYLVTALPISPAGLGLREITFAVSLAQFGVPSSDAALVALGVFLMRVVLGLLGGVDQTIRGAYKFGSARNWRPS